MWKWVFLVNIYLKMIFARQSRQSKELFWKTSKLGLNTQSCLWWYVISVSGQFGQPSQYIKKVWEPILSNFWGHCFHVFGVNFFFNFFENPIASAVKNCIIKFSKIKKIELLLNFFWNKTGFFRASKNLKFECTTKRSPIAGLGV